LKAAARPASLPTAKNDEAAEIPAPSHE
jgi:hypothetical protein